jgi:hypothetical protein
MSDVFGILRADHREVEKMLAALAGPDGATPMRSEARKQLTVAGSPGGCGTGPLTPAQVLGSGLPHRAAD